MYDRKLVISGSMVEFYLYGRQIEDVKQIKRFTSVTSTRAELNLRRLIAANAGMWFDKDRIEFFKPLFLTLTFADNMEDLDYAHKEFNKFIKRFNYQVFQSKAPQLAYIAVPEFQKRGAVHYHLLCFNVPFIAEFYKVFAELWGHGFINVKIAKGDSASVGWYFTKYMTKAHQDPRLGRRKHFFRSKNLYRPYVTYDLRFIIDFMEEIPFGCLVFSGSYESEFTGHTGYEVYDLGAYGIQLVASERLVNEMGKTDEPIEFLAPVDNSGDNPLF